MPRILSTLAVDPAGSAIVQIPINPGDAAVQYNFSEVLVADAAARRIRRRSARAAVPPPPPTPPLPPPVAMPFVEYQPVGSRTI